MKSGIANKAKRLLLLGVSIFATLNSVQAATVDLLVFYDEHTKIILAVSHRRR